MATGRAQCQDALSCEVPSSLDEPPLVLSSSGDVDDDTVASGGATVVVGAPSPVTVAVEAVGVDVDELTGESNGAMGAPMSGGIVLGVRDGPWVISSRIGGMLGD